MHASRLAALLIALLPILPGALALVQGPALPAEPWTPAASPAGPMPLAIPDLATEGLPGLLRMAEDAAPVGAEAIASMRARLPAPFGASEVEAMLDAPLPPLAPALASDVVWTGDVLVTESLSLAANLIIDNARVTFASSGLAVEVLNPHSLTIRDSTLQAAAGTGTVGARGPVLVQRATFEAVGLAVRQPASQAQQHPALVEDSTFRLGGTGIADERTTLEVRGSTFYALSTGIGVTRANVTPEAGPFVHDNTFVMTRTGISVGTQSAGIYRANVARANVFAVSCSSAGATDAATGSFRRARFEANNLYTNYGEAIAGLRGITLVTPVGTLSVSNSGCDHQNPYLGPPGAARDSFFLSADDTLTISNAPNPTAAPPLPVAVREVTGVESWTGTVVLDGPVVVNAPGRLTVANANLVGPYFFGAKTNGQLSLTDSVLDPAMVLIMRNDADTFRGLHLGSLTAANPVQIYRCNCTLRDSTVLFGALGVLASGGLLTDDSAWRPEIAGSTLRGPGVGALAYVVRLTLRGSLVENTGAGLFGILGTLILDGNSFKDNAIAGFSILGTLQSSGNVYDGGTIGFFSALDTLSSSNDVFARYGAALYPILDPAISISLANFTYNMIGIIPLLGSATISSSNFVDNYMFGILVVPTPLVPSSATCSSCWAPADEAWHGDVTWAQAVAPNTVGRPSWHAQVRAANHGQTVDLAGVQTAPAIARAGGTLRIQDTTVDFQKKWPAGAKGAGMGASTVTGRLLVDNATLVNGLFLAVNGTSSRITQATFQGFGLSVSTLPPAIDCMRLTGGGTAVALSMGKGTPLAVRRLLVEGATGVTGNSMGDPTPVSVRDSAILEPRGNGLLSRSLAADFTLASSNLFGSAKANGAVDSLKFDPNRTANPAMDLRGNWWGSPAGPGIAGPRVVNQTIPPLVDPVAPAPNAPVPCAAIGVATRPTVSLEPATFQDRSFDPSGLGIVERTWSFGDGSAPVTTAAAAVEHVFPRSGTFPVTLTVTSASGATATVGRSVLVLARPVVAFGTDPSPAVEGTAAALVDRTTDEDGHVVAWSWTCAGGFASAARQPTVVFPEGGATQCALTVTDNDGLTATSGPVDVAVDHAAPRPAFRGTLVSPRTVRMVDLSTHPGAFDAPPAGWTYVWDFGDGSPLASGPAPVHAFPEELTYTVTLTVTDNDGMSATASRPINAFNTPPTAEFRTDPAKPVAGAPARFVDLSADTDGTIVGWLWSFGSGQTSTASAPTFTWERGGDYPVTLTVTDDQGGQTTVTRTIHVCETGTAQQGYLTSVEACTPLAPHLVVEASVKGPYPLSG